MNTSIQTRAAALVAAILVTFGTIALIADYAYPVAPPDPRPSPSKPKMGALPEI